MVSKYNTGKREEKMKKMKKLIAVFGIIALSAVMVFADETEEKKAEKPDNAPASLITMKNLSLSGYGAPTVNFGTAAGEWAVYSGGRGGLIINDSFVIGGGGMGLVYPQKREKLTGDDYEGVDDRTMFGYGGVLFEYHFSAKDLFHFSLGTIIGAGSLGFFEGRHSEDMEHNGGDVFFAVEPEIMAYVNVTRFLRIGAGATYRFVNGINTEGIKDSDFRGFNASLVAAFGWF
jgi:hypothetical protein